MTNHQPSVPFTSMTDLEHEAFSYGDCWRLAYALHLVTGWQMAAVIAIDADGAHTSPEEVFWGHMLVETPCGRYMDVAGVHDYDTVIENWSEHLYENVPSGIEDVDVVSISPDEWEKMTAEQETVYHEFETVGALRTVAERVLAAYVEVALNEAQVLTAA